MGTNLTRKTLTPFGSSARAAGVAQESAEINVDGFAAANMLVDLTALGGTPASTALDVKIQYSPDRTGSRWIDLPSGAITQLTATGRQRVDGVALLTARRIKIVYTLAFTGGTTPTGTFQVDLSLTQVSASGGSGGGGGASTIADGADANAGTTTDAAVAAGAAGTMAAKLRSLSRDLANLFKNIIVNGSVTRPADATAYAAGDAVTDSTSAPTVVTFTNCAPANGGSGVIIGATMIDSANKATKGIFDLFLFDTTFTPDNDNAAISPTDAEMETLIGVIPFDTSVIGDPTADAAGNAVYQAPLLNLPFVCGGASRNLFGQLVARNAYTPVSGEKFTVRLTIQQNP